MTSVPHNIQCYASVHYCHVAFCTIRVILDIVSLVSPLRWRYFLRE